MTTTLNHYPTTAQIRALLDADDLAALVAGVNDHYKTEILAEYHGKVTPDMLGAWATFVAQVQDEYPEAEVTREFKVVRKLNQRELEEVALNSQQSSRYYHPENYPLDYAYDDDTGKYVPVNQAVTDGTNR